jgi:hypothetical protein
MATNTLKPRWALWEMACIEKAFAQKIQHKIMALSLGKTVSAVSKKITQLGLRIPSKTRGHIKGNCRPMPIAERGSHDRKQMRAILEAYAPLSCAQEGTLALERGYWDNPAFLDGDREKKRCMGRLAQANAPFTYVAPLDAISLHCVAESYCVSLMSVDLWAMTKGFKRTGQNLTESGLAYWKAGSYFSYAQLLIHINQLRSDRNLEPLALKEEEWTPLLSS